MRWCCCLFTLLFTSNLSVASDRFQPYLVFSGDRIGGGAGDLDGDGLDDFLTVWIPAGWPSVPLHMRARKGTNASLLFDFTPSIPGIAGYSPLDPRAGDLDLDGHDDLALTLGYQYHVEIRSGLDGSVMAVLEPWMFGWNGPPGFPGGIGFNMAPAGDLNGDGWPELIIVGGPPGAGQGVVILSGPSLNVLYSFPPQYAVNYGWSIGPLSDLDGDGLPEFYIGSPAYSPPGPVGSYVLTGGRLEVYSGASGTLMATYTGTQPGQQVGWSICEIGDLTGDGLPEIASLEFANGPFGNPVRVVVREAATFSSVYTLFGLGGGVACVPDADGDGVNEVIAAQGYSGFVVFSGATGLFLFDAIASFVGPTLIAPFPSVLRDVTGDGLGDFGVRYVSLGTTFTPPPYSTFALDPWGLSSPGTPGESRVYAARNLDVVGPTLVGGSAQFDLLVPRHPGKAFQIVFSLDGSIPGMLLGSFYFPLLPDGLFISSYTAGFGGVLGAAGTASVSIPIPANPALHGLEVKASGWVIDPAAAPLPIASVLTGTAFTIQ